MSYRLADSLRAGSVPSWKPPDDGQRNCSKHVEFYSRNKCEKLVHLFGFIIRIDFTFYHFINTITYLSKYWYILYPIFFFNYKRSYISCSYSTHIMYTHIIGCAGIARSINRVYRNSSVGIATLYGPAIVSCLEERFSAPVQTGPGAHPASYTMGTGSLPGVEAAGAWGWPPTTIQRRD